MKDTIIVIFVIAWIYFMVKRGGCCGGHSHKRHQLHDKRGNSHYIGEEENRRELK